MTLARALRRTGLLLVFAMALVAACRDVTVTAVDVGRVVVTPGNAQITIGQRMTFAARVEDATGRELPRTVVWNTSAPNVAAVTSAGEVLALAAGTARISASSGGVAGEAVVTIVGKPVARVELQPSIASVTVGDSVRFQATLTDADGAVLTGRQATWSVGDANIAVLRAATGWVVGQSPGSTTVAVTSEGVRGEATFSVRPAVVVGSVTVAPPSSTIPAGQTVQLVATVRTGDGAIINPPPPITWTSASNAIATVSPTGVVMGIAPGSTTITATSGGQSGQAAVTVTSTGVTTVRIEPRSLSMVLNTTFQLNVRAFDQAGTELMGRTAIWSTLNAGIVTVDATGLVRAVAAGQGRIVATIEGRADTATIFVVQQPVANVAIAPASPSVLVNDSTVLQAILTANDGTQLNSRFVTWTSSDTTIARIISLGSTSQSARVTGRRAGSVTITALVEGRTGTTTLQVLPRADLRVTKTGPAAVNAGDTITWTVGVANTGPSTAANVVLRDTLPASVTFVSATGSPTQSGNVLTWPTIATLASGGSASFTVRAIAPPSGTVVNVAAATSATAEANPVDNRAAWTTSIGGADVSVAKTAPAQTVNAGDPIDFTVLVTNLGTGTAAGVTVTDSLPANATFVSATGGPTQSGRLLTWPVIPSLANGASVSYTVRVVAPASGSVVNVARVASTSTDPNAGNNRSAPTIAVNPVANLSVSKTASPAVVNAGDTLTYTIQVSNTGPSDAVSVVVTDTLPLASVLFIDATGGASLAGNVLTWPTLATLAAGGSVNYTVRVEVSTSGAITNIAAVTATTADANPADNRATVTTNVPGADVVMNKSGPALVKPGDTITYTLQVSNLGPGRAHQVVVTDSLPPAAQFVDAVPAGSLSGTRLTWTMGNLQAGASQNYTVRVVAPVASGVVNVGLVSARTGDPAPGNNRSAVFTQIAQADVAVGKTGPATVNAGDIVTYTVSVSNVGTADATGVVVTDTLPSNATFLDATGSPTQNGNVLSWPAQTLAAGGSVNYTVRVTAPVTAATLVNAAAAISTTSDANPGNNWARVTTTVVPIADLEVTKSGPATVNAGGNVTYTLTISNKGPSPAANVVLSDTLPANNAGFVSASGNFTRVGNAVTWNLGTLSAGGSANETVVITAPNSGTLNNVARGTSSTADPDGTNNRSTTSTTVNAADLAVSKGAPGSVNTGAALTYTLSWVNNGPGPAVNVVLTDTLPAGVVFVDATGGPTYDLASRSLTWPTVPTRAAGASPVQHTVNVTVTATSGTLTNVAAVTAATADPNAANSRATASTVVLAPDLVMAKSGPATVGPGATITYTLQATNAGTAAATGVAILDTLPANATFIDATGGVTPVNGVLTFAVGALGTGAQSQSYTVRVQAPTAADTATVLNVARVISTSVDANPANNRATVTTKVVLADLTVSKSGPATAFAGDTLVYVIQTSNAGPSAAAGVVVTDTLPVNATFVRASRGGTLSGNVVTWPAIASLANGATQTDTVLVRAPNGGNARDAAAALATTFDPDLSNNTDDVTTAVTIATDLEITKTVDKATAQPGDTLTYTITLRNLGPVQADNVVVTDVLPNNVTFLDTTGGGVHSGNTITWDLGQVPISVQVFTVRVHMITTGTATNNVNVTSATTDKNPANNASSATTTVS